MEHIERTLADTPLPPKVGVVVVNFNGLADTLWCIDSLLRVTYSNLYIYVVDNGSKDLSILTLQQLQHPSLTLLATGENLGFSGGNNYGIRRALADGCKYLLLLNNDAVIEPDAVTILVGAFAAMPRLGVAQGKIYRHAQPDVIWNLGADVAFDGAWMRLVGANQTDKGSIHKPLSIGYASGCMLFTSAEVIRRIGSLEDAFFFLSEDADFGMRARKAGYAVMCIPTAVARHKISKSGSRALQMYFTARNRLLLIRRHAKWYKFPVDVGIHLLISMAKLTYMLIIQQNVNAAKAVLIGLVDGLRGRFGRGRIDRFVS